MSIFLEVNVDKRHPTCYYNKALSKERSALMAQAVERHLGKVEATGSSPVESFNIQRIQATTCILFIFINTYQ